MADLTLPGFEMDCRDWLVLDAADAGYESGAGTQTPVLAVLSTVVIDEDIVEASGALSVGLLADNQYVDSYEVAPGTTARELRDGYSSRRRFVMAAPGDHFALLAEFVVDADVDGDLGRRIDALMASFRWQAA